MKIKKGFVLREVCGQNVIVGEGLEAINFGRMLSLNDTAAWIWKEAMKEGEFTADTLAVAMCEEYDVSPERALADIKATLEQWLDLKVIE
ncbi:MAG: PqqD family protein [Bacteroidales bacterium]|nr:PqqD family protein [Bacteroidales bacterium]MBO7585234.1 PqqD family protein [Bacteroidales bacterium]